MTGEPRWELADFSDSVGIPVVAGDAVIVGAGSTLTAVDKTTGTREWTFTDAVGHFHEPAVAGELVIAGDGESLYALEHATGRSLWEQSMPHGTMNAPAVAANTVYVGGDKKLLAVDLSTGAVIWSVPGFMIGSTSTEWSAPLLVDPTTAQSTAPIEVRRPEQPLFVVSDLRSPTGNPVAQGDPTIHATITNQGTAHGTTSVSVAVDSTVQTSREIGLAAGEQTRVTFSPTVETDAAAYTVGVRTTDDRERAEWYQLFTDDVTIEVGSDADIGFSQERLAVRPETTIRFRWVSENHNLVVETQPADASIADMTEIHGSGYSVERTVTVPGEYEFVCQPHRALGAVLTVLVVAETADGQSNATAGTNTTVAENTTAAESASSNTSAADDSDATIPGFGAGLTAASIASASYLARRRVRSDESTEE